MQPINDELKRDFASLLAAFYNVSADAGDRLDELYRAARAKPLDPEDAARLTREVVGALRRGAEARGDRDVVANLEGDLDRIVQRILAPRASRPSGTAETSDAPTPRVSFVLSGHNGITPSPVKPAPVFQGRAIPMNGGFADVTDVKLWDENARIEIHLQQFRRQHGRVPTDSELLDIILSRMKLPGVGEDVDDQFQIQKLARSIAQNGVRKPPILDIDGTPLDGNRRLAACRYILESSEFDAGQKARAKKIFVWQLTEHATDDDRRAVEVSLNFEDDCKQEWPEYVKARHVHEDWQAALALNPTAQAREQTKIKKDISMRYALGPDAEHVNRYIKMVEVANEFEDYHRTTQGRDEFEVKHKADHYFQYFDELSKGARGGVAFVLNQDDTLKHLVFDLLYDGKFKNWPQIRMLKHVANHQEAMDTLRKARDERDPDAALDHVDNALALAKARSAEQRELGANTRIETFVDWIEQLPVRAFRDQIRPENLRRLQGALKLVDNQVQAVLATATEVPPSGEQS